MDVKKEKKFLVPLDGSDRSLNTVRYIARNKAFHHADIVLFHVFSAVPESYWDLENDLRSAKIIKHAKAWEQSQKRIIQKYLDSAKDILVKAGVPAGSIRIKVQKRKKGIARDIIREARNNYTAVVIRRRGFTVLRSVALGSVAAKLIEWIGKKFEVSILTSDHSDSVAIEDTDFWKEMQSNRIGNLLSAARLKAGLSQSQLAEKLGIRQNMVSDYEKGYRKSK